MVYYNPYITGEYNSLNPLDTLHNQHSFRCSNDSRNQPEGICPWNEGNLASLYLQNTEFLMLRRLLNDWLGGGKPVEKHAHVKLKHSTKAKSKKSLNPPRFSEKWNPIVSFQWFCACYSEDPTEIEQPNCQIWNPRYIFQGPSFLLHLFVKFQGG